MSKINYTLDNQPKIIVVLSCLIFTVSCLEKVLYLPVPPYGSDGFPIRDPYPSGGNPKTALFAVRCLEKVLYLRLAFGRVPRQKRRDKTGETPRPHFSLFTVLKRCSTCGSPLDGFPVKKGETRQGKPQDRTFRCSLFTVHCSLSPVHCSLLPNTARSL
jgi:hypothetical protein